jgi:GWxTD domain-containing protein
MAAAARAEDPKAGPLFSATPPRFAADLTPTLQSDGSTKLQVTIQIPYTQLQFLRVAAGYGAAVDFMVVLRDKKDRTVGGDAWEERFVLRSFAESKTPNAMVSVRRRFTVEPGQYRIRVQLRDVNSGSESEVEGEIEIEGLGGGTLGLADPTFGDCLPDTGEAGYRFVQNASRRYVDRLESFCIQGRVYDARPDSGTAGYRLVYEILDDTGKSVSEGDTVITMSGPKGFLLRPDVSRLFLGTYRLELKVEEGERSDEVSARFEIEALTVPRDEQWDVMVEALGYLVSPAALASLRDATTETEREQAWIEFWGERDPSPETERNEALLEFVRRIRYANSNFRGFGPGWKTDQGRVYIQHGNPDQIEERPMTERSRPTQIWHYYELGRDFVFIDRDGFGRYELQSVVEQ